MRETKYWKVTYSDGHTLPLSNPVRPTGNAVRHLNAERDKGRDHGNISSIKEVAQEAFFRPVPASNHVSLPTLSEVKEEIEVLQDIIDPQKDSELYKLIQILLKGVERSEKLIYKLYDLSQEGDIYDAVFLAQFCERIRRSLYESDNDLREIEKNLKEED